MVHSPHREKAWRSAALGLLSAAAFTILCFRESGSIPFKLVTKEIVSPFK
jgi:hypothetical protein